MTIRTSVLSLQEIPDYRLKKLHLIHDLYNQGRSNREIADHLNERGIRTPKGGTYSPKLVWVTVKKFMKRQERMTDTHWTVDRVFPARLERVHPSDH